MSQKRLRVFAGPNGSGKSTFIRNFPVSPQLRLGVYVNADDIEKELVETRQLNLATFNLKLSTDKIQAHFKSSGFSPIKLNNSSLWESFRIEENKVFYADDSMNSYIAADIAEFIRQELLTEGLSFSFETVMSDLSKVDFLNLAKKKGYRIYLYYFSTEDPLINRSRVNVRVLQKGHAVSEEIIERRYFRSLNNLKAAVQLSHRAYVFDSTGITELIAEITDGEKVNLIDTERVPNWVMNYLFDK
jgi:predicted ABC-type ATPase